MRRYIATFFAVLIACMSMQGQSLTTVLLPQTIEGINGTNANRIPFAYRVRLDGLLASATYRYFNTIVISADAATSNGAGNCIFVPLSGDFTRTTSVSLATAGGYGTLTTDATGSFEGWFVTEPTGNATRFLPGRYIFMRIVLNDGAGGTTPITRLTTVDSVRVVKLNVSADDSTGTGLRCTSQSSAKDFVFAYDNTAGTGRPISGSFIESDGTANTTANSYAAFYANNVEAVAGAFGIVLPNTLPNGIRRFERRSLANGALVASATDSDGVWPSGANTVNPTGGTTEIVLTGTDVSLGTGNFVLSPTALNLDSVAVGNSKVDSVVVRNTGVVPMNVTSIVSSNTPVFTVTPTSTTIAAGDSAKIIVRFTPSLIGPANGIVVFTHDAPGSLDTLTVAGVGKSGSVIVSNGTGGGAWASAGTWQGGVVPTRSDSVIVLSPDSVYVTADTSCSGIRVLPSAKLSLFDTLTVRNASVSGLVVVNTGARLAVSGTTVFTSGSTYQHALNGGNIPLSTWAAGSTCLITGVVGNAPANGNQSFYNVIWNCPSQNATVNMGWNRNVIGGSVTVTSTGTGRWQMCAPLTDSTSTVTINGDVTMASGNFTTNGTSNGNTTIAINHYGNVSVTGGNFSISRGSQSGTGTAKWYLYNGNFSMSNATTQNSNPTGARFVFAKTGTQSLTLGLGNTLTALPFEVNAGATLNTGTSVVRGSGLVIVNAGATLECGHAGGIDSTLSGSGTKTLSTGANFTFSGSSLQNTGRLLPDTLNNMAINNGSGVLLSDSILVNGTLSLANGHLDLNGKLITLGPTALLSETTGNTVAGTSGAIMATRTLNAPSSSTDIAGLGVRIGSSANLGSTVIARGHAVQSPAGSSIKRFFDITPTNNSGLGATFLFRYDQSELNGLAEANLRLFRSTDNGGTWAQSGGTVDTTGNLISLTGVDAFSRWTAAEVAPPPPPPAPLLASPASGSTGQAVSLTLRWHPAATATLYRVQLATDSLFTSIVVNDSSLTDTLRLVSSLANNTKFYWRVNARNAGGNGPYSSVWNFTTIVSVPAQVVLVFPANGATNQPVGLTLGWRSTPQAAFYRVQLATDSLFTNLIVNDSTLTDTLRAVSSLANNTQYFWRANARNAGGNGTYSSVWSFTTIVTLPVQVILISPVPGATISADSVRCIWQRSTPAITNYWFERALDSLFTSPLIDSTLTDTSKVTRQLLTNTNYWWRVKAKNVAGWGQFSNGRRFVAIFTGVDGGTDAPLEFSLKQNYPNPFNPTTNIKFSVDKSGKTLLEIYNILGQRLLTLFDETVEPGRYYTVQFNGQGLPSGLYFYRLQSGNKSELRKLLLLK